MLSYKNFNTSSRRQGWKPLLEPMETREPGGMEMKQPNSGKCCHYWCGNRRRNWRVYMGRRAQRGGTLLQGYQIPGKPQERECNNGCNL